MGLRGKVDDETMYTTWVAHGRNARKAADALGMEHATLRWHASTKKWEERWQAEFNGTALAMRKMALLQAAAQTQKMLAILMSIAENEEETPIARIAAVREFLKVAGLVEAKVGAPEPTVVEAVGIIVEPQEPHQIESQIREQLESNIIEANEQRMRRSR